MLGGEETLRAKGGKTIIREGRSEKGEGEGSGSGSYKYEGARGRGGEVGIHTGKLRRTLHTRVLYYGTEWLCCTVQEYPAICILRSKSESECRPTTVRNITQVNISLCYLVGSEEYGRQTQGEVP